MPTMPLPSTPGQPDSPGDWFATAAGRALLDSEVDSIHAALAERPGQPWLWLSPAAEREDMPDGLGLRLQARASDWRGAVRCALPLPLANESVAAVVVQHVTRNGGHGTALLSECARVLVPGGRLWLFALNPLSPYRWRWNGNGLRATEPMPWRRRLRACGMHPDAVSQGLGPRWRIEADAGLQPGPGLRAAWLLRAEKRAIPLTPLRTRAPLRIGSGVPAA
jgi:SAM-dependent methyltransferase